MGFVDGVASVNQDKVIYVDPSGRVRFEVFSGSALTTSSGGETPLTYGVWHHVAGTADGTTARCYVDGVEVGNIAAGNTFTGYTVKNIFVGFGGIGAIANKGLYGKIDEVAIYTSALSATRVLAHYSAGAVQVSGFGGIGTQINAMGDLQASGVLRAYGLTSASSAVFTGDMQTSGTTRLYGDLLISGLSSSGFPSTLMIGATTTVGVNDRIYIKDKADSYVTIEVPKLFNAVLNSKNPVANYLTGLLSEHWGVYDNIANFEVLTIASGTGYIGINNTSPKSRLSVGGNIFVQGNGLVTGDLQASGAFFTYGNRRDQVQIGDLATGLGGQTFYGNYGDTLGNSWYITGSGWVQGAMTIKQGIATDTLTINEPTFFNSAPTQFNTLSPVMMLGDFQASGAVRSYGPIFTTGNIQASGAVLAAYGNVGIGTANPSSLLHLKGPSAKLVIDSSFADPTLTYRVSGVNKYDLYYNHVGSYLELYGYPSPAGPVLRVFDGNGGLGIYDTVLISGSLVVFDSADTNASRSTVLQVVGNTDSTGQGPLYVRATPSGLAGVAITLDATAISASAKKWSLLSTAQAGNLRGGALACRNVSDGTYAWMTFFDRSHAQLGNLQVSGTLHAYSQVTMASGMGTPIAPGAGRGALRWEPGTNAGTLKLVAYAGTSTTGTLIVDNVGAGS